MKRLDYKVCKVAYEDIFAWRELKLLRHTLCETVFTTILKNYIDSLPMKFTEEGHSWYVNDYELAIRR